MRFLLPACLFALLFQTAHAQTGSPKKDTRKILVPYRDGVLWGYSDTLGKILVKPAYDSVTTLAYDGWIYKSGKEGVINHNGIVVLPPVYDMIEAEYPEETGYIVKKNGKKGIFSEKGKQVIPILYDTIIQNQPDQIIVGVGRKQGMYNRLGKLLVPVQYDELTDAFFDEDVDHTKSIMGRKGEKYWLISKQTGKAAPYKFQGDDSEEGMSEGLIATDVEEDYYVKPPIDSIRKRTGAEKVAAFSFRSPFGNYDGGDYYLLTKNGKQGLFHWKQNILAAPISYDSILYVIQPFSSDYLPIRSGFLVAVKKDGRAGIVNEKGDIILPFAYDHIAALPKSNNGFELTRDGKKGIYLLYTFYPIIAPKYDAVMYEEAIQVNNNWNFSLYKVWYKGQPGYVGENGVEYFK